MIFYQLIFFLYLFFSIFLSVTVLSVVSFVHVFYEFLPELK